MLGNVQVTTRLVGAACPALYWTLAALLERPPSARSRLALLAFVGVYGGGGAVLHANAYPWM